jgi:D-3-phosphoglycerate dehydrogenase
MRNILKLNKISSLADKALPSDYTLLDKQENPDGIMLRSFSMHDYALPASVLAVARAGAGTNNIPSADYAEKGVVVFNTPGANANAVKELVICSMLMCGRKVFQGIKWTENLKGQDDVAKKIEDGKKAFIGGEILGKTLGIVGLGAIGVLVAEAAHALGMKIVGYDPFANQEKMKKYGYIQMFEKLEDMYPHCDFITLHVPLNDGTRYMINSESIKLCKDGVNIINCARGELCDNKTILECVENGKINRYVTDFPSDDLLGIENIITTPHLGASTPEAEDNCAEMAAHQLAEYLDNGNIINSVNYPAISMERAENSVRVCVLYKGGCDVKEKIESFGIDVLAFKSVERKGFAVAIADISSDADTSKINLPCAIRVRIIK